MICGAESAKIMLLHIERDKPQRAENHRFYLGSSPTFLYTLRSVLPET